jgi:hypothetical protein
MASRAMPRAFFHHFAVGADFRQRRNKDVETAFGQWLEDHGVAVFPASRCDCTTPSHVRG